VVLAARRGDEPGAEWEVPVVEFPLEGFDLEAYDALRADPRAGPVVAGEVRAILHASSLPGRAVPYLREFAPDLVYERYSLFARSGATLARELDVPLVLEVNAPLTDEQQEHRALVFADAARRLEQATLLAADRVVTVSPELERWAVELGVEPDRVTVLSNAVDPARFELPAGERERIRQNLGLDGQPVVAFLGTLKPWHDGASLVSAIALLRKHGSPVHLLVIGDGPDRPALEEIARLERIETAVTFTGAVPHEEVPALLAASDVAAATYDRSSGFYFSPLKLFEYFAAGRPVVGANIGEIGHCVRPGETGLLYPPGDVAELAAALDSLLADPPRAESMGRAGREHVREHHTWERNAQTIAELAGALRVGSP
jgi:glycosyltransferase involved in cell wall biosynthesis